MNKNLSKILELLPLLTEEDKKKLISALNEEKSDKKDPPRTGSSGAPLPPNDLD